MVVRDRSAFFGRKSVWRARVFLGEREKGVLRFLWCWGIFMRGARQDFTLRAVVEIIFHRFARV